MQMRSLLLILLSAATTLGMPTSAQATWEPPGPSNRRTGLAISEINYHPETRADGRDLEFVEIYNSNPWVEELDGYRMTGDVDFAFPAGASIPAKGRLVIARQPGDVEAVHGITGVLGPFAGSLSNEGGTLRLRKASGAIVQEVTWDDRAPWPVAADGTGHSLVLVRPSYGENNPRAWDASAVRGGSPGAGDTPAGSPQDSVVINEVLARSNSPLLDFIELRNRSPQEVDISGCALSDDSAELRKFVVPDGTILPGGGLAVFDETQLGFALDGSGETIYFSNADETRVVDVVRFGGQEADVSIGRSADNDDALQPLVARTPGTANAARRVPEIVISEIFFNPPTDDDLDEWLELTNTTGGAIDVGGWKFIDGIDLTIPAGKTIAAAGRLVVAKNAARTRANPPELDGALVVGDYNGTLSNSGETLTLARPEVVGPAVIEVQVDTVRYRDAGRSSKWADGGGSSLEATDLRADRSQAEAWADSDESAKAPWTSVSVTGALDLGAAGLTGADRVQLFLMGEGEALVDNVVVAPNGTGNAVANGGFDSGLGGWTRQGNQQRSSLASGQGVGGGNAMLIRASEHGDPDGNRVFTALSPTLAPNSNATLSLQARWLRGHSELLARLRGGYLEVLGQLEVPKNLGTPGAPNSRAVANAGPVIREVTHFPVLPAAGSPFHVFARVTDPDGVESVTLRWRADPSPTLSNVPMHDDGANGDWVAGDGIYTGTLPALGVGTLVAFRVEATDAAVAAASAIFPPNAPEHECRARVGDPSQGGDFANYRVWITSANVSTWASRAKFGNEPIDMTFVYAGVRAVYGGGAWYAGSEASTPFFDSPVGGLCGYNLILPKDDTVLEEDHFTLDFPIRDVTDQREVLMFWMAEQLRLPNLYRRYVHLFINGQRRGTISDDVQQPDGTLIDSYFPNDNNGHLYKSNNWIESPDDANSVDSSEPNILRHYDSGGQHKLARYRWNWRPRAARSVNEFDDLFALIDAVNTTGGTYQATIEDLIDVENWMRTFAFHDLCSYWDAFGNWNHKNTYLYKPTSGRWTQFTWDMDVGLGVFLDFPNYPLFPATIDPKVDAMQAFLPFRRIYWRAISEALGSFFSSNGVTAQLQKRYSAFLANGLSLVSPFSPSGAYDLSVTQWIDQRRAYLQSELDSVNAAFAITSPPDVTTATPNVTITGTTPLSTSTLSVNDLEQAVTWLSLTAWRINVVPLSGQHDYVVRALDSKGAEVGTGTVTINYTGVSTWPELRISEWLAANTSTNADPTDGSFDDWLEIYNPTNAAVSLGGWSLSDSAPEPGTTFIIPAGFTIPAGGRRLVWCDEQPEQSVAPDHLHASLKLSSSGETLALRAPDGTLIDTVAFGAQYDDISQGRLPEGGDAITFLTTPTPEAENSAAPPIPGIALQMQGHTLTLTLSVVPNFIYRVEMKEDLRLPTWTPLGEPLKASGPSLEFVDPGAVTRERFYRVIQTP